MLEKLKKLNPELPFSDVCSTEFAEYGRVITGLNTDEIVSVAKKIELPKDCSCYIPSEPSFESLAVAQEIQDDFFGELPTQVGYTYGNSHKLNALEWHSSSEINIAVTPLVILVAKRSDVFENKINSNKVKAFYVPEGTVIECYATTLHFCPCNADNNGFGWIVALPKETNTLLDKTYDDKLLFKKNKWVIIHPEHKVMADQGAVIGINGINFEIKV